MEELVGGKDLNWIFQQIAEKNDETALEAASEIIRSANDRELRSDLVVVATKYQSAKDSVAMHDAMEELVGYTKKQLALILIQGFRMGQGYQQKIANDAFKEILQGASEQVKKSTEKESKESSETKSKN